MVKRNRNSVDSIYHYVGLNNRSDGLNSRSVGLNSRSVGLNGGFVGLNGGSVELNSRSVGLNSGSVGLNSGSVGLNGGSVGLNSGSVGLNSGSVGLNDGSVGLNGVAVERKLFLFKMFCSSLNWIDNRYEVAYFRFQKYKITCYSFHNAIIPVKLLFSKNESGFSILSFNNCNCKSWWF